MTELKIQIDDTLIKTYGYTEIEKNLYDFISKLYVKISANKTIYEIFYFKTLFVIFFILNK